MYSADNLGLKLLLFDAYCELVELRFLNNLVKSICHDTLSSLNKMLFNIFHTTDVFQNVLRIPRNFS